MNDQYMKFMQQAPVWFAGIGPGDPDLLTLKAQSLIRQADIILHEGRQINPDILAFRNEKATLVNCKDKAPSEMVDLILPFVHDKKLVARLHTGDPSIFSPAVEEIALLEQHRINARMIPGISAAFLGAALAQKSLTTKDRHQAVTFTRVPVTKPLPTGHTLQDICRTGAAMAIYLANKNPDSIVQECQAAGLAPDALVLAVSSSGYNDESVSWVPLMELPRFLKSEARGRQQLVIIWP